MICLQTLAEGLWAVWPSILILALWITVGTVAVAFYVRSRRKGLLLVGIAIFTNMIPNIVFLTLGGPLLYPRLIDQGYTLEQIHVVSALIGIMNMAFQVGFMALMIFAVIKISKDQHSEPQT